MNLAGPSLFIDDAYCKWMQDVLVDRPGQIRMRGPLSNWYTDPGTTFTTGMQGLGAAETITPTGDWRGAVFTTGSSTTDGAYPSSPGLVKVFDANAALVGTVTLPFILSTKWDSSTNHWSRNTIIDAKPALGGGVWIGITDEYGVLIRGIQALLFWRGAGKAEHVETSRSYTPDVKTITLGTGTNVETGMFVFDTTADVNGNGRYLGVISGVSGNTITLEKEPLVATKSTSAITGRTLTFTSFRGFVHQHGRGVSTTDGGKFITSGRLGSDAEGLFGAQRATIGTNETNHRVFVYRYSDHQFIGKIKFEGTVSNTQVEMTADSWTTAAADFLKDDNYFLLRDDSDTHLSGLSYDTQKYSMLASHRRHDSRAALISSEVYTPIPGIFNSTYANRQWFASVGNTAVNSDEFVNRVVFSGTDNPENINLSPDASDSIIIPGREAIRGIAGSVSGLLVYVESKTYIIRGTNRQNFALEELYPDGTLCASSIVQVGGGVIWAGKSGIYYYDGVSVRNFTNEALGIFYTDGVHTFNAISDRIYSFVYNNYLIINFSKWQQNYALSRWQATAQSGTGSEAIITLDNNQNYTRLIPTSITFNIYLPTGAIGTLSNMTPRGYMNTSSLANTKGIMIMNSRGQAATTGASGNGTTATINVASNPFEVGNVIIVDGVTPAGYNGVYTITARTSTSISFASTATGSQSVAGTINDYTGLPTSNKAALLDLSSIFTEILDTVTLDSIKSNDTNRSTTGITKAGPDFYLETKQYNFGESTLRKWWRKILFNLSINNGFMMSEMIDINDNSLVDAVTGETFVRSDDESGYFLIPSTSLTWGYYDLQLKPWSIIEGTGKSWSEYFGNKTIRYSKWIGIRQNSLGFKFYSLLGYRENNIETIPELVTINDWVFGLKPLRKGRN
jgi:hypothetical protein